MRKTIIQTVLAVAAALTLTIASGSPAFAEDADSSSVPENAGETLFLGFTSTDHGQTRVLADGVEQQLTSGPEEQMGFWIPKNSTVTVYPAAEGQYDLAMLSLTDANLCPHEMESYDDFSIGGDSVSDEIHAEADGSQYDGTKAVSFQMDQSYTLLADFEQSFCRISAPHYLAVHVTGGRGEPSYLSSFGVRARTEELAVRAGLLRQRGEDGCTYTEAEQNQMLDLNGGGIAGSIDVLGDASDDAAENETLPGRARIRKAAAAVSLAADGSTITNVCFPYNPAGLQHRKERLHLANGVRVYCIEPTRTFQSGTAAEVALPSGWNAEEIKKGAMLDYYLNNINPESMHNLDGTNRDWLVQVYLWSFTEPSRPSVDAIDDSAENRIFGAFEAWDRDNEDAFTLDSYHAYRAAGNSAAQTVLQFHLQKNAILFLPKVNLQKVDAKTGALIPSAFKFRAQFRTDQTDWSAPSRELQADPYGRCAFTLTDASGLTSIGGAASTWQEYIDREQKLHVRIIETEAPRGYETTTQEFETLLSHCDYNGNGLFIVHGDSDGKDPYLWRGDIKWTNPDVQGVTILPDSESKPQEFDLPETGSSVRLVLLIVGVILMVLSVFSFQNQTCRRR